MKVSSFRLVNVFLLPFIRVGLIKSKVLLLKLHVCVCMYVFPITELVSQTIHLRFYLLFIFILTLSAPPFFFFFFFFYYFCSSLDMLPSQAVSQLSSFSHFPPGSPKYTQSLLIAFKYLLKCLLLKKDFFDHT